MAGVAKTNGCRSGTVYIEKKKCRYIYNINAKQHEKYNVNDKKQIPERPLDIICSDTRNPYIHTLDIVCNNIIIGCVQELWRLRYYDYVAYIAYDVIFNAFYFRWTQRYYIGKYIHIIIFLSCPFVGFQ